MGQLPVRAVHLGPRLEHGQDRLGLLGQDAVQRGPARLRVDEPAGLPTTQPPVGAPLGQVQPAAGPPPAPPGLGRLVEQREQRLLGGRVDPVRDLAT